MLYGVQAAVYLPSSAQHAAGLQLLQAVGGASDLVHAAAGKATKTDDLALLQRQAEIADGAEGDVVEHEGILVLRAGGIVLTVILFADFAADHHVAYALDGVGRVHLRTRQVTDDLAVAQHSQIGALFKDFVHIVGNEHHGLACLGHTVHEGVEACTPLHGQGGGRLIHH